MLTPFEPWHLLAARLTPEVAAQAFSGDNPTTLVKLAGREMAYTIVADDGSILGIAGAAPLDSSRCEVFVVASEERRHHARRFVRDVVKVLKRARHRFAIVEAVQGTTADRWFRWLGFAPVAGAAGRWRLS